jgi:hypothetical protein
MYIYNYFPVWPVYWPVSRPVCGLGCGCLVRLRFALRSPAVWRVRAIAPDIVSGWRACSSVSLSKSIIIFLCQSVFIFQIIGLKMTLPTDMQREP